MSKAKLIKDIREIIGNRFTDNPNGGAKTNDLGISKTQTINLAKEIADYIESIKQSAP